MMIDKFPAHATVNKDFSVSAEKVFDAWLDAEMIGKFMFGPELRDEQIVSLNLDTNVGGLFSFIVRRKGVDVDHIGEYLEINRPHHLTFIWAVRQDLPASSRIVIDIVSSSNGCSLTLTQQMPADWADFVDRAKFAWLQMLEALARVIS